MRNIWTIFKTDIRTLSRCFFACVVVLAIALLPSLYAWLNIYSNWDPYGSTGGISIAVASLDRGYTDGGEYVNKGRDVLEDLKTATSINWVIVDTEKEATDGVCAGDYYAAVVIDEDFSRKMYRMFTDWNGRPAITYYENAKKNAVATKITDTAVETLKRSISENYLEVVIGGIMEQGNLLAEDLTADDPESAVKGVLYQAQDLLNACGNMMDAFEKAGSSGGVSEKDAAALEEAVANINKNLPDGSKLHETAAEIQTQVNAALARVERVLEGLENAIANAPQLPSAQQQLRDAAAQLGHGVDGAGHGVQHTQKEGASVPCGHQVRDVHLRRDTGEGKCHTAEICKLAAAGIGGHVHHVVSHKLTTSGKNKCAPRPAYTQGRSAASRYHPDSAENPPSQPSGNGDEACRSSRQAQKRLHAAPVPTGSHPPRLAWRRPRRFFFVIAFVIKDAVIVPRTAPLSTGNPRIFSIYAISPLSFLRRLVYWRAGIFARKAAFL